MIQILKGKSGKSRTVDDLLKNTESICYVYYDLSLPLYGYSKFVNSHKHSLNDLKEAIMLDNDKQNYDSFLDYFIIYTNNTENELQEFLQWLELFEHQINANTIIVTCK